MVSEHQSVQIYSRREICARMASFAQMNGGDDHVAAHGGNPGPREEFCGALHTSL